MRNVYLATTMMIAVGGAAGRATAADALKLGITGFYRAGIGVLAGGDSFTRTIGGHLHSGLGNALRRSSAFQQQIRINFTGETTLDNGLTIGVLIGLNGENLLAVGDTTTPQKQSYADFSGRFGEIRFGEANSALRTDCTLDPGNVTAGFGVNTPSDGFSFSNAGNGVKTVNGVIPKTPTRVGVTWFGSIGTCHGIESRGTKIAYFSPSIGGFTFGLSFAPSGDTRNPGGGYFYGTDLKDIKAANVLAAATNYIGDLGGVKVTAGGGGEWAFDSYDDQGNANPYSPAWYQTGFQLGFSNGIAVGASAAYMANYNVSRYKATDGGTVSPGLPGDDGWLAALGASYVIDAWGFGLQGIYSSWQVWNDTGHDNIWGLSLNFRYLLGPGIQLEGQVAYSNYDANDVMPVGTKGQPLDYHAVEFDGGFAINF